MFVLQIFNKVREFYYFCTLNMLNITIIPYEKI